MSKVTRITKTTVLISALYVARGYFRNWGATKSESNTGLPGDALVRDPVIQTTEAVDIDASAAVVWTSLLQLCQDAGGFYSFDGQHTPATNHCGHRGRDSRIAGLISAGDLLQIDIPSPKRRRHSVRLTVVEIVPEKRIVLKAADLRLVWNAVFSLHVQAHWEDRVRLLARGRIALRHPAEVFAFELIRPFVVMGLRALLLGAKHSAERQETASISMSGAVFHEAENRARRRSTAYRTSSEVDEWAKRCR